MHISEVHKYRDEKDHLMKNEGKHPANQTEHPSHISDEMGSMNTLGANFHGMSP